MATEIPKVGYFTNAEVANFTEEQRKLSTYLIAGMKVDFGKQNWKRTFAEARRNEIENNRTASQLSAKLQCFQWINSAAPFVCCVFSANEPNGSKVRVIGRNGSFKGLYIHYSTVTGYGFKCC